MKEHKQKLFTGQLRNPVYVIAIVLGLVLALLVLYEFGYKYTKRHLIIECCK